MNKQSGFTLIELVIVIVILGILAVTSIPKFNDLTGEAESSALKGVVGIIQSSSVANYGVKKSNSAKGVVTTGIACNVAVPSLLEGNILPSGYTITTTTNLVTGTNICVLNQTSSGNNRDVVVIGVP